MSFVPGVQKQSDCFSRHILKGIVARGIEAVSETVYYWQRKVIADCCNAWRSPKSYCHEQIVWFLLKSLCAFSTFYLSK